MRDRTGSEREPRRGQGSTVHDIDTQSTPTVRIAARDRWPVLWAGLIGLFLGSALLKPWEEPSLARPTSEPAAAASAPGQSTGPDLHAALREHCQEPIGWRVYSRELWIGRQVRTWRSLEPVATATGPADPGIPVVPLGPAVEALGYCSPWSGPEDPPDDARIAAWRHDRGANGLTVLSLRAIAPADATTLGALFGPIAAAGPAASAAMSATAAGWPAGRYVFALRATGWERWWSVQVAPPDRAGRNSGSSVIAPTASPVSP